MGAGDLADDVGFDEAGVDHPGPEGGEADVVVVEGFAGDAVGVVGEEGLDVVGGDLVEGGVGVEVLLEEAVGVVVVGDGVGGEGAGVEVELVALEGLGEGDAVGFHLWVLLGGCMWPDNLIKCPDNRFWAFFGVVRPASRGTVGDGDFLMWGVIGHTVRVLGVPCACLCAGRGSNPHAPGAHGPQLRAGGGGFMGGMVCWGCVMWVCLGCRPWVC